MAHYKLSDVVVEINERENNPSCSKYERFVGLEHYVSGEVIIRNYGSTELLASSMKIFKNGDILVARRNVYLKRASMVDFDGLTSGDSIVLRAKNPVIGRVLPFVLNTEEFWDFADQYSDGTMSKRLSPKTLMTYEFDLPEENELEYFGNLLWAANDTKESYQQLLVQTDELVKSQFIEMFGLPFTEECTPNGKFGDFTLEMLKGPCGSDMKKTLLVEKGEDTYNVYLQINAIQQNEHLGESYISKEYYDAKMNRFSAYPGDYLITCDGTLGKFIRLDEHMEPGVISPSLLKVKLNEERIVPRFFEAFWELFIVDYLVARTRNTALVHLPSAKVIGDVDLYIPEMSRQQQYAEFAKQSDKSKCCEQRYSRYCLRGGELCA